MNPYLRHSANWLAIWLSLVALATACTPATPEPPPGVGDVLFSDDFTTTSPNWALFDTPEGAAYIQQERLYLEDRGPEKSISTSLLDQQWSDLLIRTHLQQAAGTQNNWMGVTCRQADENNYYLFAISADGYYLLLKVVEGETTQLAGPETSTALNPDRGVNLLEASCVETTLTLSVNQQELVSLNDEQFRTGGIALFADSVTRETTSVAFDDFVITAP
ncbi:MAG TPA: hypothetical protein G4N98_05210 [Thermoflexia bacterium]|nr:hypothetical protein [Thermoflexia bacterium]